MSISNFIYKGEEITMEFRQLETFVYVAKMKSFSKAAEKMFITQPTVSNHIQNLERELDTILINRMGRSIELTEAGQLLYDYALDIINSFDLARYKLGEYSGKIKGNIDIVSSSLPRKSILPNILNDFLKLYPEITFNISYNDTHDVLSKVQSGNLDFGLVGNKLKCDSLIYVDILDDELLLITPKNIDLKVDSDGFLPLNSLLNLDFIQREEGSGTKDLVLKALSEKKINKLNVKSIANDTETIKELVALGLGCSFVSKWELEDEYRLDRLNFFKIRELDLTRKFYFVYNRKVTPSPLSRAFKDFIEDYN